jgi:hypothetical protein
MAAFVSVRSLAQRVLTSESTTRRDLSWIAGGRSFPATLPAPDDRIEQFFDLYVSPSPGKRGEEHRTMLPCLGRHIPYLSGALQQPL